MSETLEFDEQFISFWVPGTPAPGGSKKFVGHSKRTGRAILIDAAGARNKNWRAVVGWYGTQHAPKGLLKGPLKVSFDFIMPRPKYHYKKDGTVKPNAPIFHTVAPDTTKLIRSTEDALTSIVWLDDSQICRQAGSKLYGEKPGAQIMIKQL